MIYRKPPAFVRNDMLTAGTYGQMLTNGRTLEEALRAEHTGAGEHNTPLIARTLGTVLVAGGPTYSLAGFNADASLESGHNPSIGKLILTLAANRYEKDRGVIQVQNASVAGVNQPMLSWARWFDDTRVEVFSTQWTGTLGSATDEHWETGGVDCAFHLGVHGRRLAPGALLDFGAPLQRRVNGLRVGHANKLIQASADLQVAMDFAHTGGVHDAREIPKAWAHVQYNGAGFDILDQEVSDSCEAGEFALFDIDSTGVINCAFDGAFSNDDYQVFVDVDYSRLEGSADDYFICCAPHNERSNGSFFLYFYKQQFSGSDEIWDRSHEVDFHVWVYEDS